MITSRQFAQRRAAVDAARVLIDGTGSFSGVADREGMKKRLRAVVQQLKSAFSQGDPELLTHVAEREGALLAYYGLSGTNQALEPGQLQWAQASLSLLDCQCGNDL